MEWRDPSLVGATLCGRQVECSALFPSVVRADLHHSVLLRWDSGKETTVPHLPLLSKPPHSSHQPRLSAPPCCRASSPSSCAQAPSQWLAPMMPTPPSSPSARLLWVIGAF